MSNTLEQFIIAGKYSMIRTDLPIDHLICPAGYKECPKFRAYFACPHFTETAPPPYNILKKFCAVGRAGTLKDAVKSWGLIGFVQSDFINNFNSQYDDAAANPYSREEYEQCFRDNIIPYLLEMAKTRKEKRKLRKMAECLAERQVATKAK